VTEDQSANITDSANTKGPNILALTAHQKIRMRIQFYTAEQDLLVAWRGVVSAMVSGGEVGRKIPI
jgi:hypothetical protein